MVEQMGQELRDIARRMQTAASALAEFGAASPGDVERDLYQTVEQMRARHVTPSVSAEELVHLFAGINAVSLVAEGLGRVSAAMPTA